jgi:hypothetical protein
VTNPAGSSSSGLRMSIEVDKTSLICSLSLLVLLVLGWMTCSLRYASFACFALDSLVERVAYIWGRSLYVGSLFTQQFTIHFTLGLHSPLNLTHDIQRTLYRWNLSIEPASTIRYDLWSCLAPTNSLSLPYQPRPTSFLTGGGYGGAGETVSYVVHNTTWALDVSHGAPLESGVCAWSHCLLVAPSCTCILGINIPAIQFETFFSWLVHGPRRSSITIKTSSRWLKITISLIIPTSTPTRLVLRVNTRLRVVFIYNSMCFQILKFEPELVYCWSNFTHFSIDILDHRIGVQDYVRSLICLFNLLLQ